MYFRLKKGLNIYLGPMFSGKTTKLLKTYNLLTGDNEEKNILLINHASDNRYGQSHIISHDGQKLPCYSFKCLNDIFTTIQENILEQTQFILIDEGQFFDDLFDVVLKLLVLNKTIFIAGLDGDFKQRPFPNSKLLDLIPYAITVEKLHSLCYICKEPAPMTKRLTNHDEIIHVGHSDIYQPICLQHTKII